MLSIAIKLIRRFAVVLAVVCLSACSPKNQVVDSLDKAIGELGKPAANWYSIAGALAKSLPDAGSAQIGADLERLIQSGLASSPPEGRCDANLIRERVRQGLNRIRVKLDARKPPLPPSALLPVICEPSPAIYDLDRCVAKLDLYGHDLNAAALAVSIKGVNGQSRNVEASFVGESGRLVTLDTAALKLTEDDAQIIVSARQGQAALVVIDVAAPVKPPPVEATPAVVRTIEEALAHVEGRSFGENKGVTYGRKCTPGHHRSECSVKQLSGSGQCEPSWVDPTNQDDCRCRVQFKIPAFESLDCRVRLTERANARQQVAPKKVVCG
jgi:hypothetical protein